MSILDWTISVGAVLLMFGQGWWFSRQKSTEDYFVGGRSMHWLAVGLSMFATTFSPLSFIGQPRYAAFVNYHLYLAILFIPLFAVPIAAWLFVPIYHRLRLTSAYEYLELRFDRRVRRGGRMLYGLYVLGWMGTMLYATSLIIRSALGLDESQRILTMILLGAMTVIYTTAGGYKAAVWTNVIKSAVLAGVVIAILVLTINQVDGGWSGVCEIGREHHKFDMFSTDFDISGQADVYGACAFGMFVYLAAAVTTQTAVQRYVSMPTVSAARKSLVVHGIGTASVCLLFFLLGTAMYAFYVQNPAGGSGPNNVFPNLEKQDYVTIDFVRTHLAYPGLLGLLLAALLTTVMGSVSSGLSSMSALAASDWFAGKKLGVRASRWLSAGFGVATLGAALFVPYLGKHVFDIIMRLGGGFLGPLLGLFLLGALVRRANAAGATIGFAAGMVSLALIFPSDISQWWYGAFTCVPTFVVGLLASLCFPAPPAWQVQGLVVSSTIEAPAQEVASPAAAEL